MKYILNDLHNWNIVPMESNNYIPQEYNSELEYNDLYNLDMQRI